jgi:glycosyltransferase involved in cell wall biosynthesis
MKNTLIILTPGFPKDETDSTCIPPQQVFVRAVARNFPQLDIMVLSFHYPYHKTPYTWHGIPVIPFGGRNKGGINKLFLKKRIREELANIYASKRVAGILSFWCGECALIGSRFARAHNSLHYSWILGQDAGKTNNYIRRIKPAAGELVALSDFVSKKFEQNHGMRPDHTIPPGIDPELFGPPHAGKSIDILGAGSLIPLKQFDIFIEVVAELKKRFPPLKVMLTGKGPEHDKLHQLIVKNDLQSTIILAGELPHSDLLQLMQQTKVFLHTSRYEGFGVVCIEALHAGAHVISFCKPMDQPIDGWHIADSKEDMISRATQLLQTGYMKKSSTPFLIDDSARSIMKLFGYKDETTF